MKAVVSSGMPAGVPFFSARCRTCSQIAGIANLVLRPALLGESVCQQARRGLATRIALGRKDFFSTFLRSEVTQS